MGLNNQVYSKFRTEIVEVTYKYYPASKPDPSLTRTLTLRCYKG